jgi:hypothetical protein
MDLFLFFNAQHGENGNISDTVLTAAPAADSATVIQKNTSRIQARNKFNSSIRTIPDNAVINKFFVLYAIKIQGMAARRFLFLRLISTVPSDINIPGTSNADSTATGIYFSQCKNHSGIFILESIIIGKDLGK